MKCVICKNGTTRTGKATVTLEKEGTILVIKGVPAEVCENCGEEYVHDKTTARLLKTAEEAAKPEFKWMCACLKQHSEESRETMKTTRSGSSARDQRAGKSARHMPDSQIDCFDIPGATDAQLRRMRETHAPGWQAIRRNGETAHRHWLSPRLLHQLRKMAGKPGKPYQTLIHELLERAALRAAGANETKIPRMKQRFPTPFCFRLGACVPCRALTFALCRAGEGPQRKRRSPTRC